MTWPQGPGDPYGQHPGGYDPYGQQQPPSNAIQPYSGPAGYQPGYQPYAAYPPRPKTNPMAIVSLVCSLGGIFIVPLLGSIAGIIFGHIAKSQLKTSGEGGDGMATAGLVIGYIFAGLYGLGCCGYVIFVMGVFGLAGAASSSSSSGYTFILPSLLSAFGIG
ncbi:DUF4190 domain-containing protein [Actinocatenispora rupis]|uniref:DUF4190 domain-containing protein n=1 Tax=Actinocatenispora rupis TaxID=519421 RepID=A0A8J3JCZ6_9ACTN|nr:DUF4190 domain-containing protein [Actinocatenispora rupis]GID16135.1 hypothetical protein Aru02nite_70240 [Actinocatenispora rupis]